MTASIPYRPEVDGLRAVAVLAVVIYHVRGSALPGGFAGVDCFFAISGFLIFSLLDRERQLCGAIDWVAFVARRATRLLPEACVLIVAVMLVGYFVLLPIAPDVGDVRSLPQRDLAESGAAAALWSANFYFAAVGIGYFHPGVWREPLVHLWSLGVEEQFYLSVPLLFVLAAAVSRAVRRTWEWSAGALLGVVFGCSLAVAVWWSYAHPWSAYYMLPTRAYEFVVGAVAALWLGRPEARQVSPRAALAMVFVGGGAVVVSFLVLSRDVMFPGFWALVPTVGTTLVIVGSGPGTAHVMKAILTLRGMVYLGRISYGWYLWHWPMLVFWREYRLYDVSIGSEVLAAAVALVPAAIGYHAVARLRMASHAGKRRPDQVLALGLGGIVLTLVACGALGLASRQAAATPEGRALNARLKDRWSAPHECISPRPGPRGSLPECSFGDPAGSVTVVLWGDSHALHWLPALDPLLRKMGMRGVLRAHAGCPAGFSGGEQTAAHLRACVEFNAAATADVLERSRAGPLVALLFSRWAVYVNDRPYSLVDRGGETGWAPGREAIESSLRDLVALLGAARIPVGIALPVPELRFEAPNCLYRRPAESCAEPRAQVVSYLDEPTDMIKSVAATFDVDLLDPMAILCPGEQCQVMVGEKALYFDDDHLSGEGARHLTQLLRELLQELSAQASPEPPAIRGAQP